MPQGMAQWRMMRDVTNQNFGYLISYILPGFVALWGVSHLAPTISGWLGADGASGPTVGGFLYVTIGSVGAGLLCSTVRWMVIDAFHHRTGIKKPEWNFATLADRVEAFSMLVDIHYRYYLWHANTLVAVIFAWGCRRASLGFFHLPTWDDLGFLVLSAVLLIGSRDNLRKYQDRSAMLLAKRGADGETMPASTANARDSGHPDAESDGQPIDVEE